MNMNILELKKFGALDIILLVLFVIYIVFPIPSPQWMVPLIDSPIGMLTIFVVTISLFVYRSPILGVLYIFVAYELLRRSALVKSNGGDAYMVKHTPSEDKRQAEMVKMNPTRSVTLEEDVIRTMAPAQVFNKDMAFSTDFKPVAERVSGASLYK